MVANYSKTALVPILRYRDLQAAIDWLCSTLGFEVHFISRNADGSVAYAQLIIGNAIIILAPMNSSAFDRLMVQPDQVGGAETQMCYFFVADADAHYALAKSANAELVIDISENDRGQRGYSCRDPEGHIWSFGTFNPWRHETARRPKRNSRALVNALSLSLSVTSVGFAIAFVFLHPPTLQQRIAPQVAAWSANCVDSARGVCPDAMKRDVPLGREGSLEAERCAEPPNDTVIALRKIAIQARLAKEAADLANEATLAALVHQQHENAAAANATRELLGQEKTLRLAADQERSEALERVNDLQLQLAHQELTQRHLRDLLAKERGLRTAIRRSRANRASYYFW